MIAEGFTCQRYGFNVGADKFSLLTIENGKTSIMRLSEWTLISQSQKSHSDRLLDKNKFCKRVNPDVEYVEIVRANLCFAAEHQSNLVIRIPVIAGLNDEDGAQNQLLDFCRELSALRRNGVLHVQLLRQHHLGNVKYQALGLQCRCENTEPPPRENLERFAEKLNANGIKVSLFG